MRCTITPVEDVSNIQSAGSMQHTLGCVWKVFGQYWEVAAAHIFSQV